MEKAGTKRRFYERLAFPTSLLYFTLLFLFLVSLRF